MPMPFLRTPQSIQPTGSMFACSTDVKLAFVMHHSRKHFPSMTIALDFVSLRGRRVARCMTQMTRTFHADTPGEHNVMQVHVLNGTTAHISALKQPKDQNDDKKEKGDEEDDNWEDEEEEEEEHDEAIKWVAVTKLQPDGTMQKLLVRVVC